MSEKSTRQLPKHPPFVTACLRGFFLRCPRCGVGPISAGILKMLPGCSHCGQAFKLKTGEFTGGVYLSYFLTALVCAVVFVILIRPPFNMYMDHTLWVLVPLGALIPFLTHRNTIGMYMGMLIATGAMDYTVEDVPS